MSDTVDEQLRRGERAEKQVQAMLAQEISLRAEIERLWLRAEKGGPTDPPRGAPARAENKGGPSSSNYDTREERDMDLGSKLDRLTKE